jgi:hypothetical protein
VSESVLACSGPILIFLFRGEKMANAKTIEIILKAIGDFGDVKGNIDVI